MPIETAPITLESAEVRLVPLSLVHLPALSFLGLDAKIWRWFSSQCLTENDMRGFIERALAELGRGVSVPFATIAKFAGDTVVGSTRFMNIDVQNCRVEIGSTWIAPGFQRTAVNTQAKYLMLRHAFEVWGVNRVEFKTDSLNAPSRKAIARLGAVEEGTLRNHMTTWSGRLRHSTYFSVIREEWPAVKAGLEEKMGR